MRYLMIAIAALLVLSACTETVTVDDQSPVDTPRPCTREYMPVCGVDGNTYANACTAGDTQIAYESECDGRHVCTVEEKEQIACTMEYLPVCGSDGKTYGNACGACGAKVDYWIKGECTSNLVTLKYQPKQCETTPWEDWYASGAINFIVAPTEEELIVAYMGNLLGIEVSDVAKVDSGLATCEACSVCATSYYFTAQVSRADMDALVGDGWEEI